MNTPTSQTEERREIKFDIVARNTHFKEIVHTVLTLEQIWEGREIPSWLKSDNCEMLAKRRWTGLKDKHGVEIYEEDIVTPDGQEIGIVKWWEATFSIDYSQSPAVGKAYYGMRAYKYLEVIGNIWENGDLLK